MAKRAMTAAPMRRRWTLDGARAALADVRARTEKAALEAAGLVAQRDACPVGSPERGAADVEIRRVVSSWIRAMEALGLEVKGTWLVDFDNGEGCYCWRWPEERLEYFHGRDEGFEGRIRIQ